MKNIFKLLAITIAISFSSCQKEVLIQKDSPITSTQSPNAKALITENFETGTKTAYTTANLTLSSGSWSFNDALIGNSTSDRKLGLKSARVRNSGKLTMNFDKTGGAGDFTISHALYGTDAACTWQLYYSVNAGSSWTAIGSPVTTSSTTLTSSLIKVNVSGNIRFDIRKIDGSVNRLNFDNLNIGDYSASGNPIPVLSSISPNTKVAGSTAFTLTVTGSSFINGSTILWNGTSLTTTYVSATQLTASVASTLVASVGSATVSVSTPTPGGGISGNSTFTITSSSPTTAKKFLFDNRHAQTAGNADWILDADNNVAARFPTPLQSTITATTSESYWRGGNSAWGIALVKLGHLVETLPSSASITYGSSSNVQDLSNYNVFVVNEPNTVFTSSEKTAILQFVQNGGSLMMIANHNISDRNNDGWDSPAIWNDFMSNNSVQTNPFGLSINLVNISNTSSNKSSISHPVLNGSQGIVSSIQFNSGSTISINSTANPTVQGHIWTSGVTQNTTNILCATSTFGTGRVFVLADSSPVDDGTGTTGDILYNGWGVYSHTRLLMNASLWCAKVQ
jgi:hypothetical protein